MQMIKNYWKTVRMIIWHAIIANNIQFLKSVNISFLVLLFLEKLICSSTSLVFKFLPLFKEGTDMLTQ